MSNQHSGNSSAPPPRTSSLSAGGHPHDGPSSNSQHNHNDGQHPNQGGNASKKAKAKKPDQAEASQLIAKKIAQLELDAAGEKDQEAEIGALHPRKPKEGGIWSSC